jgi:hypothetical protein
VFLPALYVAWFRIKQPHADERQAFNLAHTAAVSLSH